MFSGRPCVSDFRLAGMVHFHRCRWVRDRLQQLGGRAEKAHSGAEVCSAAGADIGARAPHARGDRAQQLRAPLQDQGAGRERRRVLRHVGHVEDPRRAVLPVDRRVPAVGSAQGGRLRLSDSPYPAAY